MYLSYSTNLFTGFPQQVTLNVVKCVCVLQVWFVQSALFDVEAKEQLALHDALHHREKWLALDGDAVDEDCEQEVTW